MSSLRICTLSIAPQIQSTVSLWGLHNVVKNAFKIAQRIPYIPTFEYN
ncbi:hypothetical protein GCM10011507_02940 [Edaphobacter acidisoli]|uniref:Uncharacterized protein n=1 Tax=Edaphobacter acidisoli TaxID=2040573 RepID=A0A916VZX8_9BACT|nr:hypothetical protein GCM10011507_02940 [Edaphobacter acidisoli]